MRRESRFIKPSFMYSITRGMRI